MTDREMLGSRIPSQLKDAVDRENRANQDIVEAALRRYLGTDEAAVLEMRLDHRQREREMLVEKREECNRQIDELDEEIEALRSQIEDVEAAEQTCEETLDELLGQLKDGKNVWPGHGRVKRLADERGVSREEVIGDLRNLVDERDLPISDTQFEDGASGGGRR